MLNVSCFLFLFNVQSCTFDVQCSSFPFSFIQSSKLEVRSAAVQLWRDKCSTFIYHLFNVQHRTLNAQRRSNKNSKHRIARYLFPLFWAVLMLVTNIFISSSDSCKRSSTNLSSFNKGTFFMSFSHRSDSLNSLRQTRILWIKSFLDSAAWASPWFG